MKCSIMHNESVTARTGSYSSGSLDRSRTETVNNLG